MDYCEYCDCRGKFCQPPIKEKAELPENVGIVDIVTAQYVEPDKYLINVIESKMNYDDE